MTSTGRHRPERDRAGGRHRAPRRGYRALLNDAVINPLAPLSLGAVAIIAAVAAGTQLQPPIDVTRPERTRPTNASVTPATVSHGTEGRETPGWSSASPGPTPTVPQGQYSPRFRGGRPVSTAPTLPRPGTGTRSPSSSPVSDPTPSSSTSPTPVGETPVPSPYPHPTRRHCKRGQ